MQVIQVYAPTSNAEEAEVEQFYEDLQNLVELTPQKDILFIIGNWNGRSMNQGKLEVVKQEMAGVTTNILKINELKGLDRWVSICL